MSSLDIKPSKLADTGAFRLEPRSVKLLQNKIKILKKLIKNIIGLIPKF